MPAYASTTSGRSQSRALQIGPWAKMVQARLLHRFKGNFTLELMHRTQLYLSPKLFPKRHSHLPHHRHPTTSPRLIIIYAFGRLGQADESLACPHNDNSALRRLRLSRRRSRLRLRRRSSRRSRRSSPAWLKGSVWMGSC